MAQNDGAIGGLGVADLPDRIRPVVEQTVPGATTVVIEHHKVLPWDDLAEAYYVYAIVGRRYVHMSFSGPAGGDLEERTESYSLDEIKQVDIKPPEGAGGEITVGSGENAVSIGVPVAIARALVAAG